MHNTTTTKNNDDTIIVCCAGDTKIATALYHFLVGRFPNAKVSIVEDEVYLESDGNDADDGQMVTSSSSEVDSALNDFKFSDPRFEKCIHKGIGNGPKMMTFF